MNNSSANHFLPTSPLSLLFAIGYELYVLLDCLSEVLSSHLAEPSFKKKHSRKFPQDVRLCFGCFLGCSPFLLSCGPTLNLLHITHAHCASLASTFFPDIAPSSLLHPVSCIFRMESPRILCSVAFS